METRNEGPMTIQVRRNPYLADYERNRQEVRRTGNDYRTEGRQGYRQIARRRAARRRRQFQIRCLAFSCGVIALAVLGVSLLLKNNRAGTAGGSRNPYWENRQPVRGEIISTAQPQSSSEVTVQGIPIAVFAKHPDWEEKFLSPNEYSRPGDELKEVKNIFVHYTANPGTSAAQNRSYFERQKDEHKASVSAHFIIGYDGEIIQCVPLTEIAYAVQTRNFDSVSIECCYKAKDGSFTQETYDSLIALLAWLTDAYDLETDDILRHYDCGGKKCPLYYTNHPDKWEQLKKDVDKL